MQKNKQKNLIVEDLILRLVMRQKTLEFLLKQNYAFYRKTIKYPPNTQEDFRRYNKELKSLIRKSEGEYQGALEEVKTVIDSHEFKTLNKAIKKKIISIRDNILDKESIII